MQRNSVRDTMTRSSWRAVLAKGIQSVGVNHHMGILPGAPAVPRSGSNLGPKVLYSDSSSGAFGPWIAIEKNLQGPRWALTILPPRFASPSPKEARVHPPSGLCRLAGLLPVADAISPRGGGSGGIENGRGVNNIQGYSVAINMSNIYISQTRPTVRSADIKME